MGVKNKMKLGRVKMSHLCQNRGNKSNPGSEHHLGKKAQGEMDIISFHFHLPNEIKLTPRRKLENKSSKTTTFLAR